MHTASLSPSLVEAGHLETELFANPHYGKAPSSTAFWGRGWYVQLWPEREISYVRNYKEENLQ